MTRTGEGRAARGRPGRGGAGRGRGRGDQKVPPDPQLGLRGSPESGVLPAARGRRLRRPGLRFPVWPGRSGPGTSRCRSRVRRLIHSSSSPAALRPRRRGPGTRTLEDSESDGPRIRNFKFNALRECAAEAAAAVASGPVQAAVSPSFMVPAAVERLSESRCSCRIPPSGPGSALRLSLGSTTQDRNVCFVFQTSFRRLLGRRRQQQGHRRRWQDGGGCKDGTRRRKGRGGGVRRSRPRSALAKASLNVVRKRTARRPGQSSHGDSPTRNRTRTRLTHS